MTRLIPLFLLLTTACATAAVPEQTIYETKTCNGATVGFSVTGTITAATDVKVILVNTTTTPYTTTILTNPTHYSVTVANGRYPATAFTVTTVSTYSSDYRLVITTDVDLASTLSISSTDREKVAIQRAIERLTVMVQELDRKISQAVRNPEAIGLTPTTTLPEYGSSGFLYRSAAGNVSVASLATDPNYPTMSSYWQDVVQESDLASTLPQMGFGDGYTNLVEWGNLDPTVGDAGGAGWLFQWDPDDEAWLKLAFGEAGEELVQLETPAAVRTYLNVDTVFNVKAYGAVGNGVANDTAAIQAAIDAATAVKGIVFCPPGTYLLNSALTPASYVTVCGSGAGSVLKAGASNATGIFQTSAAVYGFALERLAMRSADKDVSVLENTSATGYVAYGVFRDLEVYAEFDEAFTGLFGSCLWENCQFGYLGTAGAKWQPIKLTGPSAGNNIFTNVFVRCNFYSAVGANAAVELTTGWNPLFSGCVWEAMDIPAVYAAGVLGIRFENCNFENIEPGGTNNCCVSLNQDASLVQGSTAYFATCKFQNNGGTPWAAVVYAAAGCHAGFEGCQGSLGNGYYVYNGSAYDGATTRLAYLRSERTVSRAAGAVGLSNFFHGVSQSEFGYGLSVKNGSTSAGYIDLYEDSDNGAHRVRLIGPASTGDGTLTLPTDTEIGQTGVLLNTAGTLTTVETGVSGTLVLDDGSTEKITLVFTNGILTSRTVEASTSTLGINWTD